MGKGENRKLTKRMDIMRVSRFLWFHCKLQREQGFGIRSDEQSNSSAVDSIATCGANSVGDTERSSSLLAGSGKRKRGRERERERERERCM